MTDTPATTPPAADTSLTPIIDQAIAFLQLLAATTFTAVDDLAVKFLIWCKSQPEFIAWLTKLRTPKPETANFAMGLQAEDGVELEALFDRFKGTLPQGAAPTGNWSEILAIVLQVMAWLKARRTKGEPVPTPAPV